MYIRRKVFSRLQDENGEERLFSVKDIDASEAPITARKDIKESHKTARHESDNETRLEDRKDRRANGYVAKVYEDSKDARSKWVENAKDRRARRNEDRADSRDSRENRMAERTKRLDKAYDYSKEDNANRREKGTLAKLLDNDKDTKAKALENRKDRRATNLENVKDRRDSKENRMQKRTERSDMSQGHIEGRMKERTSRLNKYYDSVLEDAKNRRENRYKRLDRRMTAKYGR